MEVPLPHKLWLTSRGTTPSTVPQSRPLDVFSWLALNTFLIVIVFVIYPVKIPLPRLFSCRHRRLYLTLDLATAPVLGICFLLATTSIPFSVVRDGLLGSEGIQPYSIMVLFYALAYICISLDLTGIFQFCAFWVAKRAGSQGKTLFTSFFVLTTLMSGLTSNDVVILTGTAFLVYFTRVADIDPPTAFLISEFVSANIASMALYIGNPTNVVVSQAFNISFLEYSAWMLLPTLASIFLAYTALRILFRNRRYIPQNISAPDSDARSVLLDPVGAVFGLCVLACTLATLIGTSFAGVPVWVVTLPYALLMLTRDVWHDIRIGGVAVAKQRSESRIVKEGLDVEERNEAMPEAKVMGLKEGGDADSIVSVAMTVVGYEHIEKPDEWMTREELKGIKLKRSKTEPIIGTSENQEKQYFPVEMEALGATVAVLEDLQFQEDLGMTVVPHPAPPSTPSTPSNPTTPATPNHTRATTNPNYPHSSFLARHLPTLYAALIRIPWKILPFALGMFILVEALASLGWIGIFATAIAYCTPSPAVAVFVVCFISILLCNLLNNLPMTILVTRVLQHPNFYGAAQVTPIVMKGVLFALIIGSNLGACLTTTGSLAGVMWDHILKTKGVGGLGYFAFLKWNLGIMPIVAAGASAVLLAELYVVYR